MFKSIVSLFVGENSKKRQIGIVIALLLSMAFYSGWINLQLYEALMPFVIIWTGAAFSAKLSKLQKAVTKTASRRK